MEKLCVQQIELKANSVQPVRMMSQSNLDFYFHQCFKMELHLWLTSVMSYSQASKLLAFLWEPFYMLPLCYCSVWPVYTAAVSQDALALFSV